MIGDTSAVLCGLRADSDASVYAAAMASARRPRMSAASMLEAAMIVDRKGDEVARAGFSAFEATFGIGIEDLTRQQAVLARDAWRLFGKGSGHRAQLNFGDCMAYALAKARGEPLLFKGDDFLHTDIEAALKD